MANTVELMARAMCAEYGQDPDETGASVLDLSGTAHLPSGMPAWVAWEPYARVALAASEGGITPLRFIVTAIQTVAQGCTGIWTTVEMCRPIPVTAAAIEAPERIRVEGPMPHGAFRIDVDYDVLFRPSRP